MAKLITDDLGQPMPQYLNKETGEFVPQKGTSNGMLVDMSNWPLDGILKVALVGTDNNKIPGTMGGLQVTLNDTTFNMLVHNGIEWVNGGIAKVGTLSINQIVNGTMSEVIYNNGATNLLLLFQINSGSGSITKVELQAPIGSSYVTVSSKDCSITGAGTYCLSIEGVIPAMFVIKFTASDSIVGTIGYQMS